MFFIYIYISMFCYFVDTKNFNYVNMLSHAGEFMEYIRETT